MASGPALSLDIAEKRFGANPLLFSGLKLNIAGGSLVALVGPSGVGKSTLLRMIAGIDTGFSGQIMVGGVSAIHAPPPGFVFQDARLLPWLSVIGNIRAVTPGISKADLTILLARVGLRGTDEYLPHQLSGGMQRRLALARAIAFNPKLLLLDEPFVSLDQVLVDELRGLLLDIRSHERSTAIVVTHTPDDAAQLADRVIILKGQPATVVADVAFDSPPSGRGTAERRRLARLIERWSGVSGDGRNRASPA